MPRFSIIIPVYNSEAYLHTCLDSVCKQSFADYEVLCIDDGSTDSSKQILERYQETYPFLYVCSIPNSGPSVARNKGLDLAKGEYILFCDSDDWFEGCNVLSCLDAYIAACGNNADCVFFPGNTNWGGNVAKSPDYEEHIFAEGWELLTYYCNNSGYLFFGALYAFAYRREVLETFHLRLDTSITYGEDRLWVFDFLDKAKKSIVYSKPCYFYNVHTGSLVSLMSEGKSDNKYANEPLRCAEMLWERKWSHKKNAQVVRYISRFYRAQIVSAACHGTKKRIKYKKLLFAEPESWKYMLKSVILCLSPYLYRKLFASK